LIKKAGLPLDIPATVDKEDLLDSLQLDKKVKAGKVRFILPTEVGKVVITDEIKTDLLRDCFR